MSIGNTKSDGNKGNNYPYQHNVLIGLQTVLQNLQNLLANTSGLATNTTGVERKPRVLRETSLGDLNISGSPIYSVSVANVGLANGDVLGTVISPGEIVNFSADALNNYFTEFPYDGTGTELLIIFVTDI